MSEYLIQEETLRGIADSIRAKTGKTDPMGAEQMATEIDSISAGGGESAELLDAIVSRSATEIKYDGERVGSYAFAQFSKLTKLDLPNVTSTSNHAFYFCQKLVDVNLPSLTSLGNAAFQSCSGLTNISLPLTTGMGLSPFQGCSKLVSVDIPMLEGTLEESSFQSCSSLQSVDFPEVITLRGSVFKSCSALTSVNLPKVTNSGQGDFQSCSSLENIELPSLKATAAYYMFASCKNLARVYLPLCASVGQYAFQYDYNLVKLILNTQNTTVAKLSSSSNAFQNCYHILGTVNATYNPNGLKDGYIYVPASLVADYRVATNWVTYASQIMPWVATVEELANIDGTTYDHACVGEGVDSVEYAYNGTTWEVFR